MQLKAIITTLILGTASVAAADPIQHYDARGDFRGDRMRMQRPIMLAQNLQLSGQHQRPSFISLDARNRIDKLRFDVDRGRAYVESITVLFADGHRQSIPIRQMLNRRNPSVTVDLPHAGVTGVYIVGGSPNNGRFNYGYSNERGTVDVVGISSVRRGGWRNFR